MPRSRSVLRSARRRLLAVLPFVLFGSPAAMAFDPPAPPQPETLVIIAGAGAFADGIVNQAIYDNVVVDTGTTRGTLLQNSVLNNIGITQINQDAGIGANQANIVLIAITAGAGNSNSISLASFYGEARESNNSITVSNVNRSNVIQDVLSGSSGIVQINQNSGTLNQNLNAMALAIGFGNGNAAVSLTDAGLSNASSNVQYSADGSIQQSNVISGLSNFHGIAQINQTAGDGNIVRNTMVIGVTFVKIQ